MQGCFRRFWRLRPIWCVFRPDWGGGGGRPNVVQFRPYRFDTTRADSTKHGWFRVNFMRSSMMTYAVCRRVRADFMSTASTIDRCILGILTSKFIDKAADRV